MNLLPLLLLAVLPVIFIVQFFADNSRSAAWAAPARSSATTPAMAVATAGATVTPIRSATAAKHVGDNVTDLDAARAARNARPAAVAV